MKEAVNEEHEGKRKNELTWKITRIHWEKNRFMYDLMYKRKVMSRELYDWLVREKIADGALISKWRKPGYEILCSLLSIQKNNHNFGTTSHCRVPLRSRTGHQRVSPNVQTGCISCCSGDGKFGGPIWWNTPVDDDDVEAEVAGQQARSQWTQPDKAPGDSRKRGAPEADEEDLPDEVRARLAAIKDAA